MFCMFRSEGTWLRRPPTPLNAPKNPQRKTFSTRDLARAQQEKRTHPQEKPTRTTLKEFGRNIHSPTSRDKTWICGDFSTKQQNAKERNLTRTQERTLERKRETQAGFLTGNIPSDVTIRTNLVDTWNVARFGSQHQQPQPQ